MAKTPVLEMVGEVIDVLPAGKYKVKLRGMDFVITAYKAGNMKKNNIAIMLWDYLKVEVNEYDNTQWRITYRYKFPPSEDVLQEEEQARIQKAELKAEADKAKREKKAAKRPAKSPRRK